MGYEVIWSELLVQFLSTRAYAFAVMLATYLAGLAIGSHLWARRDRRDVNPWRSFGLLIAGAGASALLVVAVLGEWITGAQRMAGMWAMRATGRETVEVSARFTVAAVAVLLLPTMLLGAAFPDSLAADRSREGRWRRGRCDARGQHAWRDRGDARSLA